MPTNDLELGIPVALLGRHGVARERLREALELAGAQVVLEDEPEAIDVSTLLAAAPAAVLVALEPEIEDALDALEPALMSPGLTVIFDEAELAMRRHGWDTQRLARHLAAKLQGTLDVLPPDTKTAPVLAVEPAAAPLSQPEVLHEPMPPRVVPASDLYQGGDVDNFELPASELFDPMQQYVGYPLDIQPAASANNVEQPLHDLLFERTTDVVMPDVGDWNSWGLVEDVSVPPPVRIERDLTGLSTGGLGLVKTEKDGVGAVLVLAGIGGPDAIRRLLGALPSEFPRIVLVRIALDGGQYANLVRQLARVSMLSVELAEIDQLAQARHVYILPDEVAVQVEEGSLKFVADTDSSTLLDALNPAESAVFMLSGADIGKVDEVVELAAHGAWVAGQSAEGCYDPAAAALLVRKGMFEGEPEQLAHELTKRWST